MSSDLRVLPPHLPERLASPSSSAAELVPESYTYCHRAQPCQLHIGCKSGSLDDDAAPEARDFIEAHVDFGTNNLKTGSYRDGWRRRPHGHTPLHGGIFFVLFGRGRASILPFLRGASES